MRQEILDALEFAKTVDSINDLPTLNYRAGLLLSHFGVSQFGAHVVFRPGPQRVDPALLFGSIPRVWADRYLDGDYVRDDPAVAMLARTSKPFTWNESFDASPSREGGIVLGEAREIMNVSDGLVIPICEPDGTILTAAFNGHHLDLSPEARPALHLLGYYFAMRGREIAARAAAAEAPPLTPRQLECLKWASEGLNDQAIADKLNLSPHTVKLHIIAAMRRFGVTKRTHAVVLAYRNNLL